MSVDVMIDLETTGVSAGCAVLSIGATTLDLEESFYSKIDVGSCHRIGLLDNLETIRWWNRQHPAAKEEAFSGTTPLTIVLGEFSDWLREVERKYGEAFVWGNGADFDLPILQGAYLALDMKAPWKPFNGHCYRTLKNLHKEVQAPPFEGMKHNALADAQHQARHMMMIMQARKSTSPIQL